MSSRAARNRSASSPRRPRKRPATRRDPRRALLTLLALFPAGGAASDRPAEPPAVILDTGCGAARAADLAIDFAATGLRVQTRCIRDAAPTPRIVRRRIAIPSPWRGKGRLASLLAPGALPALSIEESRLDGGARVRATRRNGRRCLDLTILARSPHPLPARFLGEDGDWRPALDYQIDPACTLLAIQAGNRLMLMGLTKPRQSGFGGFSIVLR